MGRSIWEETQDTLERSGLTAGLGIPLHSPRGFGGSGWIKGVWATHTTPPPSWTGTRLRGGESKVGDAATGAIAAKWIQLLCRQFDSLSDVFGLLCESLHVGRDLILYWEQ